MKLAMGRLGSDRPARLRWMASDTATTASSCPITRLQAATTRTQAWIRMLWEPWMGSMGRTRWTRQMPANRHITHVENVSAMQGPIVLITCAGACTYTHTGRNTSMSNSHRVVRLDLRCHGTVPGLIMPINTLACLPMQLVRQVKQLLALAGHQLGDGDACTYNGSSNFSLAVCCADAGYGPGGRSSAGWQVM
eukprot:351965-Chlamydomonas_euryale.AAC.8